MSEQAPWYEATNDRFQAGARRAVHALPPTERWSFAEEVWGGQVPQANQPGDREVLAAREYNIVREELALKMARVDPQRYTHMVEGRPVQVPHARGHPRQFSRISSSPGIFEAPQKHLPVSPGSFQQHRAIFNCLR